MDIAMPELNGLEATRQIIHESPDIKILILSSYNDDEYVRQMTEAGAVGYLLKQTAGMDLIKAVREVCRGNAVFSPAIAKRLLAHCHDALMPGKPAPALTPREAEVLQLVAEGQSNKQIAAQLFIGIKTVEKHRQLLMNKLNIHDIAGLTRYAISKGVIEGGRPSHHESPDGAGNVEWTNPVAPSPPASTSSRAKTANLLPAKSGRRASPSPQGSSHARKQLSRTTIVVHKLETNGKTRKESPSSGRR